MRLRTHQVSRTERVASLAAATSVTVGTALLTLAALRPTFIRTPAATVGSPRQLSEHVVYVAPSVVAPSTSPVILPTHQVARTATRLRPRPASISATRGDGPALRIDTTSVSPAPTDAPATAAPRVAAGPSRAPAGAPAGAAMVAIKHASAEPVRIDSLIRELGDRIPFGIVVRPPVPPPFTQAEKDAKWRDEAFEAVAARGSGRPVRTTMAGGSIPVPLPFGGPSRKQRERDRALYAELLVTVARRQQRVDSMVAARRKRNADSLARLADSLRPGNRPKP